MAQHTVTLTDDQEAALAAYATAAGLTLTNALALCVATGLGVRGRVQQEADEAALVDAFRGASPETKQQLRETVAGRGVRPTARTALP